ncbi:MAG: response regulator [Chitinivibrionales bacterium]|nr:response regulator [Chitinivibrionales bacterium]
MSKDIYHTIDLLERIALRMYRVKSESEFSAAIEQAFRKYSSVPLAWFTLGEKGDALQLAATTIAGNEAGSLKEATGIETADFRINLKNSLSLRQVIYNGKTVAIGAIALLSELYPEPLAKLIAKIIQIDKGSIICAPVRPLRKITGLTALGTTAPADQLTPFVVNFARRISQILETCRKEQKHKAADELLLQDHDMLQALMNNMPDYIFFKDRSSRYIRTNKAHTQLLGTGNPRHAKGKTDFEFFPREAAERFFAQEQKIMETGKPVIAQEWQVPRNDGTLQWVSTNKTPVYDRRGRIVGIIGIVRDITERKQAEEERVELQEQLMQSRKLESIGQLAGGIAHDFNNMLGAISGSATLIRRKIANGDPKLEKHADTIIEASRRAADLTAKLLAFARKGNYEMVLINVHETIGEVIKLLEHTVDRKIRIIQHLEANPATVMGDRTQLQNALLNLAINARDAMPDGGELTFSTTIVNLKEEYIAATHHDVKPGMYLETCVRDSGIGMTAETQAKIFEPFFTTKEPGRGTGLGLASVYGTVRSHNGFIEVESESGKGTVFYIYLPLERKAQKQEPGRKSRIQKGRGRILLVDDEELIREVSRDMLRDMGYSVATCSDGVEAVTYFKEHSDEIDLLIIDMIMPRMGGADCVKEIRALAPDAKIIIATGYSLATDTQVVVQKGVSAFIQKPFEEEELSMIIRKVLES